MAATYLPLLLSSVNVNASSSDDSYIADTHVSSQVDYLTHEWREEDVWRSWRSMTRQKNEIANGLRLENASWRTWWKQRNGLQTISPETLNWLKDSDVTWLYGPLHTNKDTRPKFNRTLSSSIPLTRLGTPPPSPNCQPKSILKHRTVTELLVSALPPSPHTDLVDVANLGRTRIASTDLSGDIGSPTVETRPPLMHTRSETSLYNISPFRKNSPPRIIADDIPSLGTVNHLDTPNLDPSFASIQHTDSYPSFTQMQSPALGDQASNPKKHISFNTFVEQFIAIEKPTGNPGSYSHSNYNYGYGYTSTSFPRASEELDPYEYIHYNDRSKYLVREWPADSNSGATDCRENEMCSDDEDEEDEEDDQIEIKTRSRSSSLNGIRPTLTSIQESDPARQPAASLLFNSLTAGREHVTIAPIAPTILKASSSSHNPSPVASSVALYSPRIRNGSATSYFPLPEDNGAACESDENDGDIPLLWVPPVGSGYEREYTVQDPDESGFGFAGGRRATVTRYRGMNGSWIATPPVETGVLQGDSVDYFSEQRKGRSQHRETRDGRDKRSHVKPNQSLSPAETTSSTNTTTSSSPSRSRSRSRNRNELLSPSPDRRDTAVSRGRSPRLPASRSRSRSTSSAREEEDVSDQSPSHSPRPVYEERGRTLARSPGGSVEGRSESRDRNRDRPRGTGRRRETVGSSSQRTEMGYVGRSSTLPISKPGDNESTGRASRIVDSAALEPKPSALPDASRLGAPSPHYTGSRREGSSILNTRHDQLVDRDGVDGDGKGRAISGTFAGIRGYIGHMWRA